MARLLTAVLAATAGLLGASAPAGAAASYTPISGAGSTWSSNALQQWASNVSQFGMTIQFQANGSTQGRTLFRNRTVDFAVSEIPYGVKDRGIPDLLPDRKFAYMPIVAGGTSFMYNLKIGNKQVTNLRMSGDTVVKIFTGAVTRWNDPTIKADNPGLAALLPARKIIPVVRSDGSGTTAQFTTWMSKQYQGQWDAYCRKAGRPTPCGVTSFYPVVGGSGFTAQNGSVGVAGYVASSTSDGAITYVEYSYAQNARFPVVKLLNAAGYYTLPTAPAVAVALQKAQINTNTSSQDYLTQILDGVYANSDKRTYPLSSYSYMIIPTDLSSPMTAKKGFTLAEFGYYFLCEGQQQAPDLGYSPLPLNLVKAGFDQIKRIPGADVASLNGRGVAKCNNPTFSADGGNKLARTAPQPPACDAKGSTQCADAGGFGGTKGAGGSGSGSGGKTGTGAGTSNGQNPSAGPGAGPQATGGAGAGTAADGSGEGGPVAGDGTSGNGDVAALPVSLASDYTGGSQRTALMVIAGLLLLGVLLVPPLAARALTRKAGR